MSEHLPGKFVWFEHVCPDTTKARAFYEPLFGWRAERMPMGEQQYELIMNGGEAIGGVRAAQPGMPSQWVSYLSVPDVDASHAAATRAGAQSLMPPTDFAPIGRAAALADPTGAQFCIWKNADKDRADVEKVPVGDWFWNELTTPDPAKALAFYEKVFGYTHDSMDMGAMGTYHVLKSRDGKPRAGLMQSPPSAPTLWCPYVHVADCDASATRATQLGAQAIAVPPTDIPDIGRFAVLIDPFGAAFAIIRGAQG